MPKKKTTDPTDWTSLKSGASSGKSRRKPFSWRARFRRLWVWTKRIAAAAAVAALCYGAYYAYQNVYFEDVFGRGGSQIKRLEFKTDGAISGAWLNGYLKIPRGSKLEDVNIFAVKQSLDMLSQIRTSKVERVYPDVLRITVAERFPEAKVMRKIDYEMRTYLMAADGSFFVPICIPQEKIDALKFAVGAKTDFDGSVPAPYPHAAKLMEFLRAVRTRMPEEYAKWESVDVSQIDSLTLPVITATSKEGTKYVFKTGEYPRQLDRLEYILKYMRENPTNRAEKIDLTLSDWSVVKFATPQSKSK